MQPGILTYDGSFDGFLTCVFTVFEQKLQVNAIHPEGIVQQDFFAAPQVIITDVEKANRVKAGIKKQIPTRGSREMFYAFLSEQPGIEMHCLHYLQLAFKHPGFSHTDYGNPTILKISQTAKMVSREKHRMEAFVRFMLTRDNIYFAHIEPDFNVLPLIKPHFESRYADQQWIIYDLRRKFGIYYNLETTKFIHLEITKPIHLNDPDPTVFTESELEFQKLWQQYFKSTNIKSRKNMKLHLQHVPKRYWKYLTEKT